MKAFIIIFSLVGVRPKHHQGEFRFGEIWATTESFSSEISNFNSVQLSAMTVAVPLDEHQVRLGGVSSPSAETVGHHRHFPGKQRPHHRSKRDSPILLGFGQSLKPGSGPTEMVRNSSADAKTLFVEVMNLTFIVPCLNNR